MNRIESDLSRSDRIGLDCDLALEPDRVAKRVADDEVKEDDEYLCIVLVFVVVQFNLLFLA